MQRPLAIFSYLNLHFNQLKVVFCSSVPPVLFQVLNRHVWLVTVILDMADTGKFYWTVVEHHYLPVYKLKRKELPLPVRKPIKLGKANQ